MEPSRRLRNVDLETLFDEIVTKTEQREAFSEVKETNIGFSAIEDMEALRGRIPGHRDRTGSLLRSGQTQRRPT